MGSMDVSLLIWSNSGLARNAQFKLTDSSSVSAAQAIRMPTNLPSRNCRRLTGLLITVSAVRPSISSLIEMLDAKTPKRMAASMTMS